jgi:membrane protease YdiL (CAAX protease family)
MNDNETLVMGVLFAVPMAGQIIHLYRFPWRLIEIICLQAIVPLSLLYLVNMKLSPGEVGLTLGNRRKTLVTTAMLLSLAVAMSLIGLLFPSMTQYYPIWQTGTDVTTGEFLYEETIIAIMMFCGEFFYRGLVLFTLAKRSFWGAILLQSLPYAFLHLGKPMIEVPYSLVAGIIFGWANLRSGSMLPSWITHFVGSALFDALILLT